MSIFHAVKIAGVVVTEEGDVMVITYIKTTMIQCFCVKYRDVLEILS